jgi:hypothetical protein
MTIRPCLGKTLKIDVKSGITPDVISFFLVRSTTALPIPTESPYLLLMPETNLCSRIRQKRHQAMQEIR